VALLGYFLKIPEEFVLCHRFLLEVQKNSHKWFQVFLFHFFV